jgi:hypothetical protein
MPVVFDHSDHDVWLTGKVSVDVLRTTPNALLRLWPVSKRVTKTGAGDDDPSLIEPVADQAIANGVVRPGFLGIRRHLMPTFVPDSARCKWLIL